MCELLTWFLQNSLLPVLAKKPLASQARKPEVVAVTSLLKHEFGRALLIHSGADGKRSRQRRASALAVWCGSGTAVFSSKVSELGFLSTRELLPSGPSAQVAPSSPPPDVCPGSGPARPSATASKEVITGLMSSVVSTKPYFYAIEVSRRVQMQRNMKDLQVLVLRDVQGSFPQRGYVMLFSLICMHMRYLFYMLL